MPTRNTFGAFPLYLLIIISVVTSGCAIRSIYIPVSQNVPLFDSNKTLKASGYPGINHLELQAACNPTHHFAIATNINFGSGISIYDAAIGTYGYTSGGKWRYELFGGYGYNTNVNSLGSGIALSGKHINYNTYATYSKYYLQPAIGFFNTIKIYKIKYSFSLSARMSYLYFNDYKYNEIDEDRSTPDKTVYIVNKAYRNQSLFLLEPCITNKVGIKNLYAILQVQGFIPSSEKIDVRYTRFSPGILFSVGLQYDLTFKNRRK